MRRIAFVVVVTWLGLAAGAAVAQDAAETARLQAFLARSWAWVSQTFPEWSTYRGDHRFGDRLTDNSAEGRAAQDAAARRWLEEARGFDRTKLGATDRVSLDLFIGNAERRIELFPFTGYRSLAIGSNDGAQTDLAELLSVTPMDGRERAEQLLRRLAQIGRQLAPPIEDGPFYAPFKRLPASMPETERRELQSRGRTAVEQQVLPAMRRLREFVAGECRAKAVTSGAFSSYPEGARVSELLVRNQTTTTLTAQRIHKIGLAQLSQLRARMEAHLGG